MIHKIVIIVSIILTEENVFFLIGDENLILAFPYQNKVIMMVKTLIIAEIWLIQYTTGYVVRKLIKLIINSLGNRISEIIIINETTIILFNFILFHISEVKGSLE